MTTQEFDDLFDAVISRCKTIHRTKGEQYKNGEDRLGNFKRAADRKSVTPETILSIYADKHRDSLDWINRRIEETGSVPETAEPIIETICDLVNYAVLNFALITERENRSEMNP
jgi:hypothetical protein